LQQLNKQDFVGRRMPAMSRHSRFDRRTVVGLDQSDVGLLAGRRRIASPLPAKPQLVPPGTALCWTTGMSNGSEQGMLSARKTWYFSRLRMRSAG
jgi:hypothetical protein